MITTFSCVADTAGRSTTRSNGTRIRCGTRAAGAMLFAVSVIFGATIGFARPLQSAPGVFVDYDALETLDFDDAPLVIPLPGEKPVILRPPHGVPRYIPSKIKRASLAQYTCPCARHLVLKPMHARKKHKHPARSAEVKPAAVTTQSPPVHTATHAANTEVQPPSPAPVQPKPVPAPIQPPKPVAAPAASPPPAPPAKVAMAAPPAAPQPAAAPSPNSAAGAVKPMTPPPAAANPQVLTPPPLPKPAEKPEVKTAAAPPAEPAPAKPMEITKPPAEVAAAVPPAVQPTESKIAVGAPVAVSYAGGGTAVPAAALPTVKDISDRLAADPNLRVQLFSYASDPEKNVSRSRRLSLERAVAVRKLLIDNGLDSTRIEVRALGDQNNGGEPDRVDIVLSARH